jgi:predicted amidohydrolase
MTLRVAGAQIRVTNDVEANFAAISQAIDFARREKADILLTPEGSLSGYSHQFDARHVDDALRRVTAQAQSANLGLALGTCFVEPDDGQCYNQIRFYEPGGNYLGFHSKILRTGSLTQPSQGEVTWFTARPLTTFDYRGIRIGGLICNDMWANPRCTPMQDTHLSPQLSELGVRIVFHAINTGDWTEWSQVEWNFHESNLRLRALAGRLWIVTVDIGEPTAGKSGAPSGVFDPTGDWVCRVAPTGTQYFVHNIEL